MILSLDSPFKRLITHVILKRRRAIFAFVHSIHLPTGLFNVDWWLFLFFVLVLVGMLAAIRTAVISISLHLIRVSPIVTISFTRIHIDNLERVKHQILAWAARPYCPLRIIAFEIVFEVI